MRLKEQQGVFILIGLCFLVGMLARLYPLTQEARLLSAISEDGYLMMTIARNIALGLGMSTAEGTIATNGTQPFVTGIWTLIYSFFDGDKIRSIWAIWGVHLLISVATMMMIAHVVRQFFSDHPQVQLMAWIAPAVWFISPTVLPMTYNGLETGFYALWALGLTYVVSFHYRDLNLKRALGLGVLLGAVFWIRNDAVFLILAICLSYAVFNGWKIKNLLIISVMGLTSIAVASPWLIYNKTQFGSLMPISGSAQALTAKLGDNFIHVPAALFEYINLILAIPEKFKLHTVIVIITSIIAVLLYSSLLYVVKKYAQPAQQRFISIFIFYSICLMLFYGLYFGAAYFIPRYFLVFTGFFAILWAWLAITFIPRLPFSFLRYSVVGLCFIIATGLIIRYERLLDTRTNGHFQVVNWIAENVPSEAWVGAVQTGTIGYFHDRTINLDGKVNPYAYYARRDDQLVEYILDCTNKIDYIADWYKIKEWLVSYPELANAFSLPYSNEAENISVLQRIHSCQK